MILKSDACAIAYRITLEMSSVAMTTTVLHGTH